MKEGELKPTIMDYLQYKMNAGELYYDRLNSGEVIVVAGESRRRVKLCREGTADLFILKIRQCGCRPRIIFVELKGEKGESTLGQMDFHKAVTEHGAEYYIVKSVEEMDVILK